MSAGQTVIQLEEGWARIRAQLDVLEDFLNTGHVRAFSKKEYSETYTTVYNMCTQRTPMNWSEQLYNRYGDSMTQYLTTAVLPVLREKRAEALLQELVKRWENHKIMVKWMQRFFSYLDRYYVKHHSLPLLKDKGIKVFRTLVFDEVKRDVRAALLDVVTREREGELVDRALLRAAVDIFIDIGGDSTEVYTTCFEDQFLAATAEYYSRKTRGWISEDSCPEYLAKAERALAEELTRVETYLHSTTEPKLLKACETELLAVHEAALLEKETGVVWLLTNHKQEDLARMCRLFSRVPDGLPPVAAAFKKHITDIGNELVDTRENALKTAPKDNAQDPSFIQALLEVQDKYRAMVADCFGGNALFQRAMKEAFEVFVNRDVGKVSNAELLSTFCDRLLKKTGEKMNDEMIEETLEKVVNIFSYLTDKDLFAEIYRNQLAKRLLQERSASDDFEKIMISKLKLRCGAQFTSKMEGMITDLNLANDLQRAFTDWSRAQRKDTGNIDFSVTVLTTGFWPTYKIQDITMPPEMVKCINVFKPFYDSRTQHRRLQWVYSLGTATVAALLGGRRYDLVVSTYQACVLMLFADAAAAEWVAFEQIMAGLNINDDMAKRLLHSLSCGKFKILDKEPDSRAVSNSDRFKVNDRFTCPTRKIKVPLPPMEESHNKERVVEDRSIAIEAAIVRIMKARKVMNHVQLVQEVLAQLAFFKPNPKVIKQRIEHLIEREYLERDATQSNVYKYLA